MPVFFNGRLWVTPAVMSVVDDSAMYNKNLSVGNILCIIGRSDGGEPFKALRIGSPNEAQQMLRGGQGLEAVLKAFDPSAQTYGPQEIRFIRVNPATQSKGQLLDSDGTPIIDLVSSDYGRYTKEIRFKIENGSERGKRVTTEFGNGYYSRDNIACDVFSVIYTGAEVTATITTTPTKVELAAPAGTIVKTIDLTDYPTVQQLVDVINTAPGFDAVVLDGNGNKPAHQGLDFFTEQSVKEMFTVTANLQAVVDWFNGQGEGYITATRLPNVGTSPANINWTALVDGSDGVVTMAEWQKAFSVLQTEDVQWVTPLSPNPAIHAMTDSHCAYMSNVAGMERRCIVGMEEGATDDEALYAAKNLNSDRTSLLHIGGYDYDQSGKLKLFPAYMVAAQLAGAFSGVNPGTALTNKAVKLRGLERKLRNPTDTDRLIEGGILCLEDTQKGYKVVKSITTWLINDYYNRVEISTGVAIDFVSRNVRNVLADFKGEKGNPVTMRLAAERVETCLRELARPEPMGPGVIVGDEINPPYKNITVEIEGDVMRVEFQCSPVIPINYIPVVIHAQPWSGKLLLK